MVAEEATPAAESPAFPFEIERPEVEAPVEATADAAGAKVTEIDEWFEVGLENRKEIVPVETESTEVLLPDDFGPIEKGEDSEFRAVSPEIILCGLFDRIGRATKTFEEEVARRRLKTDTPK